MADVIEQIKTELGGASALTDAQLELWVSDAQRLIQRRIDKLGVTRLPMISRRSRALLSLRTLATRAARRSTTWPSTMLACLGA